MLRWRKRNKYYYDWLDRIYRFVVRPNSRVLHVGCECGDLLAAVEPSYGVGVDADPKMIESAKKRFGHLKFYTADPHELELDEKFDYVLISNTLPSFYCIPYNRLCHPKPHPHLSQPITQFPDRPVTG